MDKFDKDIFYFLTQDENFKFAYEIYDFFPVVREKVKKEFWESVKKNLLILTENTVWNVNSWDKDSKYPKLGLYIESDKTQDLRITYEKLYEQPYYGLWMDENNEKLNKDRIIAHAESVEILRNRGGYDGHYWIGKKETGDDFTSIRFLQSILPDNKDEIVNEYSNKLYDFANDIIDEVMEMSKMKIET